MSCKLNKISKCHTTNYIKKEQHGLVPTVGGKASLISEPCGKASVLKIMALQ